MSKQVKTLLVVDDEVDICELMSDRLELEDYKTLSASSGNKAVEIINSDKHIDLIITDVRMPNGDGIQVLESALKHSNEIPVIIITGFSDFLEEELLEKGAKAVISKPINYDELLLQIEKFLP